MNEFQIVQNHGIAAISLYHFIKEYYTTKDKMEGPSLPYLMPVLPIVFNEETNRRLSQNQKRTSSFYKSLADERAIPVGLQSRMEDMYKDTLEAIDICFYKNIIEYSSESSQFFPKSRIKVPDLVYDDNKTIIASSKLLGFWFAKLSIEEICISLNINF